MSRYWESKSHDTGGTTVKRILALMLSFALVAAAPAPEGSAAPELADTVQDGPSEVCGWYYTSGCSFGWHIVQGPSGSGVMDLHGNCAWCTEGEGRYNCHPSCDPMEEDVEVQLAYAEAVDALANDDRLALERLASVIPEYVTFNADRGAIQVLDCRKHLVIGSVSVATE